MFAMRCYAFHNRSRSKDVQEKVEIFQYMEREKKRIADTRVQSYGMVNIAFSFYFQVCCILILTTTTARPNENPCIMETCMKRTSTLRRQCPKYFCASVRQSVSQTTNSKPSPTKPKCVLCIIHFCG